MLELLSLVIVWLDRGPRLLEGEDGDTGLVAAQSLESPGTIMIIPGSISSASRIPELAARRHSSEREVIWAIPNSVSPGFTR